MSSTSSLSLALRNGIINIIDETWKKPLLLIGGGTESNKIGIQIKFVGKMGAEVISLSLILTQVRRDSLGRGGVSLACVHRHSLILIKFEALITMKSHKC